MQACKARGARRAVALPVSAPFHSSLMLPAADKLRARLASVPVQTPQIEVLNNVDVRSERDPQAVKQALVRQAASPVRWAETIRAMAQAGVTHVIECGPGRVLAGMTRRIDPTLQSLVLADRESFEQALAAVSGG
jgi:[acyl-carrier-protein] S-malonyltransferase